MVDEKLAIIRRQPQVESFFEFDDERFRRRVAPRGNSKPSSRSLAANVSAMD